LLSDERITSFGKDLNELLVDEKFRTEYKGRIGFFHADVPFGYFPTDPADKQWTQDTVTRVATACFELGDEVANFLIKMCDRDGEMWRATLIAAGWTVARDRYVLLQGPMWMRRKAFLSQSLDGVNPVHYWMHAYKQTPGVAQYCAERPFGTEGGSGGVVYACVWTLCV
jgi:hypothetical protein